MTTPQEHLAEIISLDNIPKDYHIEEFLLWFARRNSVQQITHHLTILLQNDQLSGEGFEKIMNDLGTYVD